MPKFTIELGETTQADVDRQRQRERDYDMKRLKDNLKKSRNLMMKEHGSTSKVREIHKTTCNREETELDVMDKIDNYLSEYSNDRYIDDILKDFDVLVEAEKGKSDEDDDEEGKWSGKVKTKWQPKEGLFTQSAAKIATYLASNSKGLKQAMSRLNFYINRGGSKISGERMDVLERAKELLRKRYGKEEG